MKRIFAAIAVGIMLTLAGCAGTPTPDERIDSTADSAKRSEFLKSHGLEGMDGEEIINYLDRLPIAEQPTDLMAAVHPKELVLSDADQEVSIGLEGDEFYVSIAPYFEQTHECFYHSLTTCRGELANETVDIRITDKSGKVLMEDTVTSFDNGFIGVWLPENTQGVIEATVDGHTGQTEFSTTDDGATCVTTLQLAA